MPQEASGQYLLMAYLDIVVRQVGGDQFSEVNSGEGRLDLIVVHKGLRHIIETKIWRGQALYEEAIAQARGQELRKVRSLASIYFARELLIASRLDPSSAISIAEAACEGISDPDILWLLAHLRRFAERLR